MGPLPLQRKDADMAKKELTKEERIRKERNRLTRVFREVEEKRKKTVLGLIDRAAFLRVTLPLSLPGIISGISMVFLPAMTNYVVLDMLYNSTYIMGSLIGSYFSAYNWHGGSMIALVLLGIICVFTLVSDSEENETARTGGALL